METRYLGKSGTKVSALCLGTMTFGEVKEGFPEQGCSEEMAFKVMGDFAAAGGNFIDTADVYNAGRSEEIVGKWLTTQRRDDFVLATKLRFPSGTGLNNSGNSRKHVMAGVKSSCERLQTDYIDLMQIHAWDVGTPIEETLRAFDDLIRAGKVNYIGCSNLKGWQLQKALDVSKHMGLSGFVTLQPQYSLLCRQTEWELMECCLDNGVGVLPWSPLKGGWLSGKIRPGTSAAPDGSRVAWSETVKSGLQSAPQFEKMATPEAWRVIEALDAVSSETGKTYAQIAIRWLMQRPGVVAPVIGVKNTEQLAANLEAAKFELSDEHMAQLNAASAPCTPYPYEMCSRVEGSRHGFGM